MHRRVFSRSGIGPLALKTESSGAPLRIVGGAVRDKLSGNVPNDVDLASALPPEEVLSIASGLGLKTVETGLKHGTVTVVAGGQGYEITTLREDVSTDGRRAEVAFVQSFEADAARRDFTINAMSMDRHGKVFDYHNGYDDLLNQRVRFVGNARERIQEDYLRILRFFRFRARFGGKEGDDILGIFHSEADGLRQISVERVWQEFRKMLSAERSLEQVEAMDRIGILDVLSLPISRDAFVEYAGMGHRFSDPSAVLGFLVGSPDVAARLADEWRLSKAEKTRAISAATAFIDRSDRFSLWADRCDRGLDRAVVSEVLRLTRRDDVAERLDAGVPEFPVRGSDLLELGFSAGPDMGRTLKELRTSWLRSDCSIGREELIDAARAIISGEQVGLLI